MYIRGDIIPGVGRVEANHCGLPWVAGLMGEYCGVVQVGNVFCDANSGEILTDDEVNKRLNNYEYDYEHKSRNCVEWRKKNYNRILMGQIRERSENSIWQKVLFVFYKYIKRV
jgi:hypothetical protein